MSSENPYPSIQIDTNGVEHHSNLHTDNDEAYGGLAFSTDNIPQNLSPPNDNFPYQYHNNNNISRTSQSSDESCLTSKDNLFRNFTSTNKSLPSPPKNYSTYPQTTDLRPSRDMDIEELDDSPPKPMKKGFFRNKKKAYCLICCGVTILIAIIMIPLIIFVIAPSIAQGAVTESKLAFSSV